MKSLLVFQTDFTYAEGAVSSMYGVVKSVDRTLEIFDGTHEIPKFDVWSASYRLYQSLKFWPENTIYVSVVDPGVGTNRKGAVAKIAGGYYVVTPDNGSLTHVAKYMQIEEIRQIDEKRNRLVRDDNEGVTIFHGRDVFGYTAARLASGIISFEEVGDRYDVGEIVKLDIAQPQIQQHRATGIFEIADPNFGNLWTNIPSKDFKQAGFEYGDDVHVQIYNEDRLVFDKNVQFNHSFGCTNKGDIIIYNNELMKISMAVNQGNLIDEYSLWYGSDWKIIFSK